MLPLIQFENICIEYLKIIILTFTEVFPQFNIHSTPLLILVIQGLIFAFLLLYRFAKEKKPTDLLIALMLIMMVYHRTAYMVGFMGWYDTFQNTKINYFLFSLELGMGPLIYLYVRSVLHTNKKFRRIDYLHFLPVILFLIYRLTILFHDIGGESWEGSYEGEWQQAIHHEFVGPFIRLLEYSSMLLYMAFSIQLFTQYRQKIRHFFSNTYKLELTWLQLFLAIYCFLFIYATLTDMVDAFIVELHYANKWWVHFFYAIAIVLVGMKAYFTNLTRLHEMTFEMQEPPTIKPEIFPNLYEKEKQQLENIMLNEQPYLQADYILKNLAEASKMSPNEVSEVINTGFGCNFNEFINRYRVEEMKKRLANPEYNHLSILAIAFDSGFNSKATFNRIFKQFTGQSPSQFKKSQTN